MFKAVTSQREEIPRLFEANFPHQSVIKLLRIFYTQKCACKCNSLRLGKVVTLTIPVEKITNFPLSPLLFRQLFFCLFSLPQPYLNSLTYVIQVS